jgi:predicted nucleic acid-binding protein
MTVMLDLNVLLDVIQKRQPHFPASAQVLDRVARGEIRGCVPAHAVTTIHYIVARHAGRAKAEQAVDWVLAKTTVVPVAAEQFLRARCLAFPDFEDAVVAALAEASHCECVVSRNAADFATCPVPALTPEELLVRLGPGR